ncbi:uncharacterized protein [Heterodontus francisci]|uniref:uncharacterized protein n=1 Tax=Heterodontus francisci TaxID=7792 RepID=UPI00355AF608
MPRTSGCPFCGKTAESNANSALNWTAVEFPRDQGPWQWKSFPFKAAGQSDAGSSLTEYHHCGGSGCRRWSTHPWPRSSAGPRLQRRLNSFHLRCLWRILGIRWQDRTSNTEVLEAASIPSENTLLSQRRLSWLGHVSRMEDGRIPKDALYSELVTGIRPTGRPSLCFKDVCKRDMKSCDIDHKSWESVASDRQSWRADIKAGLKCGESKRLSSWQEKRQKRKGRANCVTALTTNFICSTCGRVCHSRIGLYSHSRRCFTNH